MSTGITVSSSDTSKDRKRKRAAIIKFGLAGAALLGIGLAATSAAWSDNAWFKADATAAKVILDASVDNGAPVHATDTSPVVIDFGLLNQGEDITKTLVLTNAGTVPLKITSQNLVPGTTGIFAGVPGGVTSDDPAKVVVVDNKSLVDIQLDPGEAASIDVQLTTPSDWSNVYQGETGTVSVTFAATSDLS